MPTLPQIPVPVVTIVPSTTFAGNTFHCSDVSYALPLEIARQSPLTMGERMVITGELALIKARKQIMAQLTTLKSMAFTLKVPAIEFIEEITKNALDLLVSNSAVRKAVLADSGLVIATYLVCSNNRFGYEAILHVQTFDGVVVMTEARSKNSTSQIVFNGQVIYLNGLALTGR